MNIRCWFDDNEVLCVFNRKNHKSNELNLTIIVIILYILLAIAIAIAIICKIGCSDIAAFMGSYAGGVLGGLGALLAVFLTIKYSLKVQADNSREAMEHMDMQNRINEKENRKERLSRRKEQKLASRRGFVDGIAEQIGKYITHISKYYYSSLEAERLNKDVKRAWKNVQEKRKEYTDTIEKLKTMSSEMQTNPIEIDRDCIDNELQTAENEYARKIKEFNDNSIFGNRIVANEAYFIIRTKLIDIPDAQDMILFLEEFQREVSIPKDNNGQWLQNQTMILMQKFADFRKTYVSGIC